MGDIRRDNKAMPNHRTMKRLIAENNLRQRGAKALDAERERRKAAAARSSAKKRARRLIPSRGAE